MSREFYAANLIGFFMMALRWDEVGFLGNYAITPATPRTGYLFSLSQIAVLPLPRHTCHRLIAILVYLVSLLVVAYYAD